MPNDQEEPTMPAPVTPEIRILPSSTLAAMIRAVLADRWRSGCVPCPQPGEWPTWIERGVTVVNQNLVAGRLDAVRAYLDVQPAADEPAQLFVYVHQVLKGLIAEYDYVHQLATGDGPAWCGLMAQLERLALRLLLTRGARSWAENVARETAAQAAVDLWAVLDRRAFPFDVPFRAWTSCLLRHRVLHEVRRLAVEAKHCAASLDSTVRDMPSLTFDEVLVNREGTAWLERLLAREALLRGLTDLPGRRAWVLQQWYLEGRLPEEIAAELGTSLENIYTLRCRGIIDLRQAMTRHLRPQVEPHW